MTNNVGRPRKFFTEDELILAKRILLILIEKPGVCICGNNNYSFGYYSGSGLISKCLCCGHRKRYNAAFRKWGKK